MIRDFLVFEIRKNLDLRKILVTPKIFLKSRFQSTIFYKTFRSARLQLLGPYSMPTYLVNCNFFSSFFSKSNEVWDGIEKDRWLYNLDGDEGILPKFKKNNRKRAYEPTVDEED